MESRTASGLLVEHRAAFPRDPPNSNDPATVPPGDGRPERVQPGRSARARARRPRAGHSPQRAAPAAAVVGVAGRVARPRTGGGGSQALTDTAWACLDLNASVLATMPPYLVGASSTLPADWLNNPDPDLYTSWEEFAKQLFWDYQLGEAFVLATARYSQRVSGPVPCRRPVAGQRRARR